MPRETVPKPERVEADSENVNGISPRCYACGNQAVIRDRNGLWCGRCALRHIAVDNRDDTDRQRRGDKPRRITRNRQRHAR